MVTTTKHNENQIKTQEQQHHQNKTERQKNERQMPKNSQCRDEINCKRAKTNSKK